MSLDEFWHGEMCLLECYQIAYERDKSYTAWINGVRCYEAFSKALSNAFAQRQSEKVQYSDWEDPVKQEVPKITEEEREIMFRRQQAEQNAFWFSK